MNDSAASDEFPILKKGIYANHAALAPWPLSVSEAVQDFAAENATLGPSQYRLWVKRERRLKDNLAKMITAESWKDIALLKNTTEGICLVAEGLDWQRGDNIVIPAREFPSNRLPWLAQQRHGVEIREIDVRASDDPEAALLNAIDDRTRVLSVSAIAWDNGLKLSLRRLGRACRQNNTLFFVDAIQRLGMLPLDVAACNIDCLCADAHKWLLGPEGIAVFYCHEATRPRLRLRQQGWYMTDYPWAFEKEPLLPSKSARRFEAGSPNSLGQAAFDASVKLLLKYGLDRVAGRNLENTARLLDGLRALQDIEISSPVDPQRRSAIVCFRPLRQNVGTLVQALADGGVTCAQRSGSIRLSLHYYQGRKESSKLLNIVELALKA